MFQNLVLVRMSFAQRLQYARRRVNKLANEKGQMINRKYRTNRIPFADRTPDDRRFLVTFNLEFSVKDNLQEMWSYYILDQEMKPEEVEWPNEELKEAEFRSNWQDPLQAFNN